MSVKHNQTTLIIQTHKQLAKTYLSLNYDTFIQLNSEIHTHRPNHNKAKTQE